MNARLASRLLGAAVLATGATLSSTFAPAASAADCADVEIVFARGTGEAPGVGGVGQSFVDAVRAQVGPRSVNVYPVNYPASGDFANREAFAGTVVEGVKDAEAHVQATAANCPGTNIVLGGYSQGAVVAGYATADQVPAGVPATAVPEPLAPDVADHVASVALFGKPSPEFLNQFDAPQLTIGPSYASKLIELCAQGDTICDGAPYGQPTFAHITYGFNGMTGQAATFVADHVAPAS